MAECRSRKAFSAVATLLLPWAPETSGAPFSMHLSKRSQGTPKCLQVLGIFALSGRSSTPLRCPATVTMSLSAGVISAVQTQRL